MTSGPDDTSLVPASHDDLLPAELAEVVAEYAQFVWSKSTQRAYRSDWKIFQAWCLALGRQALPATSATVAGFLLAQAELGRKPATIKRRLAAIAMIHRQEKAPWASYDQLRRDTVRAISRKRGLAQRQVTPILDGEMRLIMARITESLAGLRDRALLLLGIYGAFRASELVGVNVEHLTHMPEGDLDVLLPWSKTDQLGEGQRVAIPRASRREFCPVLALKAWLEAAAVDSGPVFRGLWRGGRVREKRLGVGQVAKIAKKYVLAVGLDPAKYAGHSLRSGFATMAARRGKSLAKIMQVTRHKGVDVLMRYIRDADRFKDSANSDLFD